MNVSNAEHEIETPVVKRQLVVVLLLSDWLRR